MRRTSSARQQRHLIKRLNYRLSLTVGLLILGLFLSFTVGLFASNNEKKLGEQKVSLTEDLSGTFSSMIDQESGLREYISTNNTLFLEPFHSGRPQYLRYVQALHKQLADDSFSDTTDAFAQVQTRAETWYRTFALVQIQRMQAGKSTVARAESTDTSGKALFDSFRSAVALLQSGVEHDLAGLETRVGATNAVAIASTALLAILAIIVLWHTLITFTHDLHNQLSTLKEATHRLESGDLAARIHDLPDEELNQLAQSFNAMAATLAEEQNVLRERDQLTILNLAHEEANKARSQFLSIISHELRTPLTSIIGFSQIMLRDPASAHLTQRQKENLERILNNSFRLLALINDVLDVAKIEAGRVAINYSQVDLKDLLNSIIEENQPTATERGLTLQASIEQGADSLETDGEKLRQVLLHLVSNALKFTTQGEITILVRRAMSTGALVHANASEEAYVAIEVQDTGIGIEPDIQERIFEAFYQADSENTRNYGGTGVGLSIARQFTTLLGGTIEVKSTLGQGSIFTVTLPVHAKQAYINQDTKPLRAIRRMSITTMERKTD